MKNGSKNKGVLFICCCLYLHLEFVNKQWLLGLKPKGLWFLVLLQQTANRWTLTRRKRFEFRTLGWSARSCQEEERICQGAAAEKTQPWPPSFPGDNSKGSAELQEQSVCRGILWAPTGGAVIWWVWLSISSSEVRAGQKNKRTRRKASKPPTRTIDSPALCPSGCSWRHKTEKVTDELLFSHWRVSSSWKPTNSE